MERRISRGESPQQRYSGLVRPHPLWLLLCLGLIALPITACGGGGRSNDGAVSTGNQGAAQKVAGDADPGDVRVIDAWVTALRRGNVDAAARYFAIPSVAENGVLVRIRSLDDARRFNESLPCGARLIRAETAGDFTTATFRLTERPGPGVCGNGAGQTAKTSFVIRNGKIAQWRRVGQPGAQGAPSQSA
jgi:limonene-1,2-epoxide hydrolase